LNSLKSQAQIEPEFTNVVWQKLEEQNPSFFQAYAIQLQLKEQVNAFNFLVSLWRFSLSVLIDGWIFHR
jgi:hypothetical protein